MVAPSEILTALLVPFRTWSRCLRSPVTWGEGAGKRRQGRRVGKGRSRREAGVEGEGPPRPRDSTGAPDVTRTLEGGPEEACLAGKDAGASGGAGAARLGEVTVMLLPEWPGGVAWRGGSELATDSP